VLITAGGAGPQTVTRLHMARRRALEDHGLDVRYGASTAPNGFAGVARAYREAALTLSYSTATTPVVSLPDLSSLESALLGANATTRQIIQSKGRALAALPDSERVMTASTVTAFAGADMNIARAAAALSVHPNTIRHRLVRISETTGHDPRTFAGLVELVCILELSLAAPPPSLTPVG
jgi:sugar diacid utilization regulator